MSANDPKLHVVMYHYVRDLPRTRYPKIKGMMLDDFRQQLTWLVAHYEMATLEAALAFLRGSYLPASDLCMVTFDDGLKEHYTDVACILAEYKVQGLFGVITSCVEDHRVAPVHMNHFLMAELHFETYQSAFVQRLRDIEPLALSSATVDPMLAQRSYPLDTQEVATFKFLFNFRLEARVRDHIVKALFNEYIGDEGSFARELYMSWEEIRQIQRAGMLVAGHTHWHRPLSALSDEELSTDLRVSRSLLERNLEPQQLWPFSYPYGKTNSYSNRAISLLRQLGFTCAFNTESGVNTSRTPLFELNRIDCNGAIQHLQSQVLCVPSRVALRVGV
jgi:peptidoglycan/xylan/chitin deacetylase (PgdA/CDA1 family)